jgi:hypothetical protein
MKNIKTAVRVVALLSAAVAGLASAPSVLAQHRHHHGPRVTFGLHVGVPLLGFPYYYPPYPYYQPAYFPAPIVIQQPPTVYVEQPAPQQAQTQQLPTGYWYYCGDARAYYPYVKECPGGWQRVAPQPVRE